jgi:hypothetical protein
MTEQKRIMKIEEVRALKHRGNVGLALKTIYDYRQIVAVSQQVLNIQ